MKGQFEIDVIIISDNSIKDIEGLGDYCSTYSVVKSPRKGRFSFVDIVRMNVSRILPWTSPHSFECYGAEEVKRNILHSAGTDYGLVIWVTSTYLTLLPGITKALKIKKVIIDFIDSPSLLMARQLEQAKKEKFSQSYELWKVKRWEQKVQSEANQTIYISAVDAVSTGKLKEGGHVDVIPNGVSIEDYSSGTNINYDCKTIGYLGNMSYGPNVEAVLWIYNNLLDRIEDKSIKLIVIGKSPDQRILKLSEDPRVVVTGMVDNIWNYVNAIDVFVLPIFTGAGLKNKVLELMYAGRPVVTTRIGNEGIDATDGEHLFICDNIDEFKQQVEFLTQNEKVCIEMGAASQKFVSRNFDWDGIASKYSAIVEHCLVD